MLLYANEADCTAAPLAVVSLLKQLKLSMFLFNVWLNSLQGDCISCSNTTGCDILPEPTLYLSFCICLHICFFPFFLSLYSSITPHPAASLFFNSSFSPLLLSPHYLKTPLSRNLSLSNLFSLPISSLSDISAHQASSFHYYFISLFWHSISNGQTSLFVSFSLFFAPSSLLSLALLGLSKQQRAVKLISWPEQTKPKPHSPSSICCYVSALWIGSFQAWSLEE